MNASSEHTKSGILIALSCLLYFTSYITRLNFNAALADIVATTSLTKSQGGLIGTALFVAYGVGQIVIGFLGDRVKPQLIISCGLIVTVVCNAVFPLSDNIAFLICVWGLNGFAQAAFWPPLIRILASRLEKRVYTTAIVWVSVASNAATILLYLIVPLLLVSLGWASVFYFAAGFAALVVPIWWIGTAKIKTPTASVASRFDPSNTDRHSLHSATEENVSTDGKHSGTQISKKSFWKLLLACNIPCIFIAIAMHGFLKDGITTWMPTYLTETFALGTSVSILANVVLPIVGLVALIIAGILQSKLFKDEVKASLFYFAVSAATLLLLFFLPDKHAALSIALSSLVVGCMHGVNLMLVSDLPARFVKYGKISTVSGLSNACTYIGSAISSYLIALLAERIGWQYTVLFWCGVALLGVIVCIPSVIFWKRFLASDNGVEQTDAIAETDDLHLSVEILEQPNDSAQDDTVTLGETSKE